MNFCTRLEYLEFMRQTPALERMLADSGIHLFKLLVLRKRQRTETAIRGPRAGSPLKRWKLSPIDKESLSLWEEYTEAKETMFFYTDTRDAPWTVVRSDDKRRARINCMRHFLASIDYPDKNEEIVVNPDPQIVGLAREIFHTQQADGSPSPDVSALNRE